MKIDPFTIAVFNAFIAFLMSAGFFGISQRYLGDMKGIRHWATALLLHGISWSLLILFDFIPKWLSIEVGVTASFFAQLFYLQGLAYFKKCTLSRFWMYVAIALGVIGNIYFIHIHFNMAAKIAVTSAVFFILLLYNSFLLLGQPSDPLPFSHRLTGSVFAVAAAMSLLRCFYYLIWNTQAEQSLFNANAMQTLFYLTHTFLLVGSSFGSMLMCNETYLAEKNQAQFAHQKALTCLYEIASRVPGVVYQFKRSAQGQFSVPYCSEGIYATFRLTPEQVYADVTRVFNRVHPDDFERFFKAIQTSAEHLTLWFCVFQVLFPDGTIRWLEGNASPTQQANGTILWHGFISDITARKHAEMEFQIAATVFNTCEGIMISDVSGKIIKVNQSFTAITGYTADEVIGQTPHLLSSGRHDKMFYTQLWHSLHQTGRWQGEIWNRRKNGEIFPEWLNITAVKTNNDEVVTHYVASFVDISERKVAEETIKQLAFYDQLTNLPNRRLLHERLKHAIDSYPQTGKPLAVLMMDLDKFKAVNDSLGHAAGDELLRQVAERIKLQLRDADTVARLGGDEFVVVLKEIATLAQITAVADRLIASLSQPFTLGQNPTVTIGASIGIAIHPQHGANVEDLMDNADIALYRAKDQGRGCFAHFA